MSCSGSMIVNQESAQWGEFAAVISDFRAVSHKSKQKRSWLLLLVKPEPVLQVMNSAHRPTQGCKYNMCDHSRLEKRFSKKWVNFKKVFWILHKIIPVSLNGDEVNAKKVLNGFRKYVISVSMLLCQTLFSHFAVKMHPIFPPNFHMGRQLSNSLLQPIEMTAADVPHRLWCQCGQRFPKPGWENVKLTVPYVGYTQDVPCTECTLDSVV